ncbi:MAG: RlpA-like double-psi beta-barrel-protein domain-containing protein-containing protein [Linnemannia elongata]|nr:MAG: RlpA-like double-psi beta-barrel-protein domain-containing protein-containing protein [Linnemannia elongata]
MVKISSILFAATVATSLVGAAPVVAPAANNSTVAIPSSPANETAPVELIGNVEEDPLFTDSYGACNHKWNGYKEPIVALNSHQMGIQSWGNPVCNRRVRIVNADRPERSVVARVVDKCPGDQCAWGSLDLSPYAFKKLDHLVVGILNITWNYV